MSKKDNLNDALGFALHKINDAIDQIKDVFDEVVEDSGDNIRKGWDELAERGQRLAGKINETEKGQSIDQIKENLEKQLQQMPHMAREASFRALSGFSGVLDDLSIPLQSVTPDPDSAGTLNSHGHRPNTTVPRVRRAAGTSFASESSVGTRRFLARKWLKEDI